MEIIDFHTHVYPEHLAQRATRATCDFYGLDTDLVGTVDALLERGTAAGATRYVLLPVAVHPTGVRHVNDYIVEQVRTHASFYGFGTVHPDMQDPLGEIEYIRSVGLKGLKLHPDMQQIDSDDERLFPIYERLSQLKLPLLIHCGDKTRDFSHPRHLRRAMDRFPNLTVIAAHLGGWSLFDEAYSYLKDTNCYLDVSSSMMFLSTAQIMKYIRGYGVHRILFGTDFPMWDAVTEVNTLMSLPLTDEEREQIAYKNALKLLEGSKTD